MRADLWEIAVPETADVDSGRETFNTASKSVGRQSLRKKLGTGRRKRSASKLTVANRNLCKHFSLILSSIFRYQPFTQVSGTF